jgi:arylsulfatase A-like enzyme
MGFLAHADMGFPGRRGRITRQAATLAEILRPAGYGTFLVGKWHLGPAEETTAAGPFDSWPLARGFDKFYGFLRACTDQYSPELVQDNHLVDPPDRPDYHLSEDIVDHAIGYIHDHAALGAGRPFFLEAAFGATHAPFQVPRRYVDKYIPVFAKGWDQTRLDRLQRQKQMGVVPADAELTPRDEGVPPWDSLTGDEQRLFTRLQAAYAGFLEHTDDQISRLLETLEDLDLLSDTVVAVLSDNGASSEGSRNGAVNVMAPYNGIDRTVAEELAHADEIGGPDGPSHYPVGWAMAGNTPFRKFKQYVDLGGVRSPFIFHWPAGLDCAGEVRQQFAHVADVTPTLLDLLDLEMPASVGGVEQLPLDGASIRASLMDATAPAARTTQYWEMFGHRAIWHDGWRAVTCHRTGDAYPDDVWRLYHVTQDFSETHDLAAERPEKLAELQRLWDEEARDNHVLPLDDRTIDEMLANSTPGSVFSREKFVLHPRQSHVSSATGFTGTDRSMRITAEVSRCVTEDEGVIVASGGRSGGYVLYLKDEHLHFEHHFLGVRDHIRSTTPLGLGDHRVGLRLLRASDDSALASILVDDNVVAEGHVTRVARELSFWGLDVGRDAVTKVSDAYEGEFPFRSGGLSRVTFDILSQARYEEVARVELGLQ